mmetsp:Transcript_64906/g.155015  ORF Transcript_64906/g.155015 Transcript_64906/m.155015 type:complete len:283 (-) Transcript_64906:45-893(-)
MTKLMEGDRPQCSRRRQIFATSLAVVAFLTARLETRGFCSGANQNLRSRVHQISRQAAGSGDGGLNTNKLREEAGFTEGLIQGIGGLFNPEAAKKAADAKEAAKRRVARSEALQKELRSLQLRVVAGNDANGNPRRKKAPVAVLQRRAGQHICFYATTNPSALSDVLMSLRLSEREFAQKNVLVVPVILDPMDGSFKKLPARMQGSKSIDKGFVALPYIEDEEDLERWGDIFAEEFEAAEEQGVGEQAKEQGISLVVRKKGDIVFRGLGRPVWDLIFSELGM